MPLSTNPALFRQGTWNDKSRGRSRQIPLAIKFRHRRPQLNRDCRRYPCPWEVEKPPEMMTEPLAECPFVEVAADG